MFENGVERAMTPAERKSMVSHHQADAIRALQDRITANMIG